MKRAAMMMAWVALTVGCAVNPYLEQSLKPAAQRQETKEWFEKEWGKPSGASTRFWGGEKWTYYRISGGTMRVLGGINPHQCEIELYFDKEGRLDDYRYSSGC